MRIRGEVFWQWADPTLHHRTHDETLDDGTLIDVPARLSPTGNREMFIGMYASSGMALHEEAVDSRPGESMTRTLARRMCTAACDRSQACRMAYGINCIAAA